MSQQQQQITIKKNHKLIITPKPNEKTSGIFWDFLVKNGMESQLDVTTL